MKIVEITKELFDSLINNDIKVHSIVDTSNYTDVSYFINGVKFICRTQNGYWNYYIQDINA
jgi:hypothetical protein